MKHVKHLILVFIIAIAIVASGAIALHLLKPASFGKYGRFSYRKDSLKEIADQPVLYAADNVCMNKSCHGEKAAKEEFHIVLGGGHKEISCQSCHGPALKHVKSNGKKAKPYIFTSVPPDKEFADFTPEDMKMYSNEVNNFCLHCHRSRAGLPKTFKHIDDFKSHKSEMKGKDETMCLDCHDQHSGEVY